MYVFYRNSLLELKRLYPVLLHHYALMPNHVHLLMTPMGEGLSEFMKILQNRFAKRFCSLYAFRGHVWQGRFKQRHIKSDADLFACGNYIEMNPVRAGLCLSPDIWSYSSYRYYAFGDHDPLVDDDPFYAMMGRNLAERQRAYCELVDKTRA